MSKVVKQKLENKKIVFLVKVRKKEKIKQPVSLMTKLKVLLKNLLILQKVSL